MEEHKKVQANFKAFNLRWSNDNKSYLLGLKTYDNDDKELQDIKSQKYSGKFDRFVIYKTKKEEEDSTRKAIWAIPF